MIRATVVGRGVIGLSCGLALARRGCSVTAVSAPPSEHEVIASQVAAAFWYPYLINVPPDSGFTEAGLAAPSLERFFALSTVPEARVRLAQATEYFAAPAGRNGVPHRWWHERPELQFRELPARELPELAELGPLESGCEFVLPVVTMPGYLTYLRKEFLLAGGSEGILQVDSLDQLQECDVIVNCTGLGARALAADADIRPVRGQVVVVRDPPYPHDRLYVIDHGERFEREPFYIVPRGSDVVLGGTSEPLPADEATLLSKDAHRPNDEVTARIIRRCSALRPELAHPRDFTVKVGLRPYRSPLRIEWEGAMYRRPVVHCYGHGGAGVTLSWGSALAVADLVAKNLGEERRT